MVKQVALIGMLALLPLGYGYAETSAESKQSLRERMREHWEALTDFERKTLEKRHHKERVQESDVHQNWHDLPYASQQKLREMRQQEIRAEAQRRLEQRRKER
ncbi:MAG: hypothetical protein OXR68_00740 [Alphaproteobacteria bacterium]|nr:hypothetical protein [Alphaproteobacteria bacterium]MDD9919138.1 hypothetical protein [Alphaproteobacteria bacterium]